MYSQLSLICFDFCMGFVLPHSHPMDHEFLPAALGCRGVLKPCQCAHLGTLITDRVCQWREVRPGMRMEKITVAQLNGLGMKLGFLGCQRQAVPRD